MEPAGFLEFKPESQVTVSVMTQAGPGSRGLGPGVTGTVPGATADHDNGHGVIYQGVGENVGGKIGVNHTESHDFERDLEESREPWVPVRGPGVRVCQGRRFASAAAAAAGPVPPVTPGWGYQCRSPGCRRAHEFKNTFTEEFNLKLRPHSSLTIKNPDP
jgi:hypothetical protein